MASQTADKSDCIAWETHPEYRCPKQGHILCIPGPSLHNGECCSVTPDRQLGFSVSRRDTHHWDIYTEFGRAFRIRGEPGAIWIFDERKKHPERFDPDRKDYSFRSVAQAMAWCADELMHVRPEDRKEGI